MRLQQALRVDHFKNYIIIRFIKNFRFSKKLSKEFTLNKRKSKFSGSKAKSRQ